MASMEQPESSKIHDRTQDKVKAYLRIILRVQIVILAEYVCPTQARMEGF